MPFEIGLEHLYPAGGAETGFLAAPPHPDRLLRIVVKHPVVARKPGLSSHLAVFTTEKRFGCVVDRELQSVGLS